MKTTTKLWMGLAALALMSPLGLLAKGTAWGEWSAEELSRRSGFVPEGFRRLESLWSAALPDYAPPGLSEETGTVLSALLGIAAVVVLTFILGKWLTRGKSAGGDDS